MSMPYYKESDYGYGDRANRDYDGHNRRRTYRPSTSRPRGAPSVKRTVSFVNKFILEYSVSYSIYMFKHVVGHL